MTDDTKIRRMGLPRLKVEGGSTHDGIGEPPSKAAYDAWFAACLKASREFKSTMQSVPTMIDPKWLAAAYDIAQRTEDRDAVTYLRRLVLWRIANGGILDASECAKIVIPEPERLYSDGT